MDDLTKQYESYIYPHPVPDLDAYAAAGGHDYSDPSRIGRKLWPDGTAPAELRILVAGCGANQAAVLAYANPDCSVVGIDLSAAALECQARLKQRHRLSNVELHQLAIEDVGTLDRKFDLIVSTGVLHHLASPDLGLKALKDVLADQGAMSLMVYGLHRRQGVYLVQEALRSLGLKPSPEGVADARGIIAGLPEWHAARGYIDMAPDLGYDAGFVDTFLNVRDRAYSVPQVMDLVRGAGLQFQSWLDGIYYSPSAAFGPDSPIHDRIEGLAPEAQWHVVDLLTQIVGAHRFIVCHENRSPASFEPDFSGSPDDGIPTAVRPSEQGHDWS